MKKILVVFIFLSSFLFADITQYFPTLEGRVVDQANLLSTTQKNELTKILENHEKQTSNQIVVVILNSLNGYEISDFSYQLGRHWQIGQKDKNNGVLLVISKKEKKLRIEVGYGLEGALTDKISYEITNYTLKPNFKIGDFNTGISQAVKQIIDAIKGEYENKTVSNNVDESSIAFIFFILIFISIFMTGISSKTKNLFFYKISKSSMFSSFFAIFTYIVSSDFTKYGIVFAVIMFVLVFIFNFINTKKIDKPSRRINNYSSTSYGSSGGFSNGNFGGGFSKGGGFSGSGGSFGGGGASGSW